MKKLIAVLLVLLLLVPVASADAPDLSIYTYDQLVALQYYIGMEIMKRPEWKEVTVPAGEWVVGVDIPAGDYSISPAENGGAYLTIYDNTGCPTIFGGIREQEDSIGKARLREAYIVKVTDGSLILAPAVTLGF